jgi:hypothetical protein
LDYLVRLSARVTADYRPDLRAADAAAYGLTFAPLALMSAVRSTNGIDLNASGVIPTSDVGWTRGDAAAGGPPSLRCGVAVGAGAAAGVAMVVGCAEPLASLGA